MEKRVLTNKQILAMWEGLVQIANGDHPTKFAYAVARNLAIVRSIVEALEKVTTPLPEFVRKRQELAKQWSKKDNDGQPLLLPGNQQYLIPDMIGFTKKLEKLKEETGQDKREEELEKLLEGKEEVNVFTVPFSTLPESIRPGLLEAILPMIDEPIEGGVVSIKEASG